MTDTTETTDDAESPTQREGNGRTRRTLLAAAGAVGVVGPAAALTMGTPAASTPEVTVDTPDCDRIRVTNAGTDDVRIRVEGPNAVSVPEEGRIFLKPAERRVVNVPAVDGVRGTYTVYDDDTDAVLATVDHDPCTTYYQVQFAAGEPKPALGRDVDDFYAREGRLLRYLHGSSAEPVTRGGRPGDDAVPAAVEASLTIAEGIQVDGEEAVVRFSVPEGEEFRLSLTCTLAPDGSFDRDERQTVFDGDTATFGPGTHELRVKLPVSHDG